MQALTAMRIDSLLHPGAATLSFEFFPPKDEAGAAQLLRTIEALRPLAPSFVSITRTGGGTSPTLDLTVRIQREMGFPAMAHLTCVEHTRQEMGAYLDSLWDQGIRNVLALRGDPPAGQILFKAPRDGFAYANELAAFVRKRHDFCIGVAGYPEGHPQCLNLTRDLENLKRKIDAGGRFIITQLFFDNDDFLRWRDRLRATGIDIPVIAGLIPIENVAQIKRFVTRCGAKIPHPLLLRLEAAESDPEAIYQIGTGHALEQCRRLLAAGVDGLHFYTLNRSRAAADICRTLRSDGAL